MIIILFGNIGSGKTSIAKKIIEQKLFKYLSIDDFRIKYGDGSTKKEDIVKLLFVSSVVDLANSNLVLELLGTGKLNELLCKSLKGLPIPIMIMILKVPPVICLDRIKNRDWKIPFPITFGSPEQIILNTERKLFQDRSYKIWEEIHTCKISIRENISLENQQKILVEINSFINANQC